MSDLTDSRISEIRERPTVEELALLNDLRYSAARAKINVVLDVSEANGLLAFLEALLAEREGMKAALAEARDLCNRWMTAAMFATPVTTMAFDPMNPEAFAESRRHIVDQLASKAEAFDAARLSAPLDPSSAPSETPELDDHQLDVIRRVRKESDAGYYICPDDAADMVAIVDRLRNVDFCFDGDHRCTCASQIGHRVCSRAVPSEGGGE